MICGKASILQKARLLDPLRPARRPLQAEAADTHLASEATPLAVHLGVMLQRRLDQGLIDSELRELDPDPQRPLPALGMVAHVLLSIAPVVEVVPLVQVRERRIDRLHGETLGAETLRELAAAIVTL